MSREKTILPTAARLLSLRPLCSKWLRVTSIRIVVDLVDQPHA
jgi:hypothetical protein